MALIAQCECNCVPLIILVPIWLLMLAVPGLCIFGLARWIGRALSREQPNPPKPGRGV